MAINHPGSQSLLVCVEIKIEKVMKIFSFSLFFQIMKHEEKKTTKRN